MLAVQAHKLTGPYGELTAAEQGFEGAGGYKREIPQRFTEERDDRLMNSILENYAIEIKENGNPTGQFFCNKEGARALATEVRRTHKNANAYDGTKGRFDEVWNHFDVNHDGLVEADRMP